MGFGFCNGRVPVYSLWLLANRRSFYRLFVGVVVLEGIISELGEGCAPSDR